MMQPSPSQPKPNYKLEGPKHIQIDAEEHLKSFEMKSLKSIATAYQTKKASLISHQTSSSVAYKPLVNPPSMRQSWHTNNSHDQSDESHPAIQEDQDLTNNKRSNESL